MIQLEQDADDICVATLARPPVNALDLEAVLACEQAFARLAAEPSVRGVLLTGAGDVFSAGVDVRAFAGYDRATRRDMVLAITRMTAALLSIPVPVVAAVNGHALGGGFVLALCCDYRLVTDDTAIKLGLPEARAGVPFPVGPTRIIQAEIPPGLLRRLALTSRNIAPVDLLSAGIVDAVPSPDSLLADARDTALQLAAQPGFAAVKRQIRGALAAEVAALAATGEDPFIESFG